MSRVDLTLIEAEISDDDLRQYIAERCKWVSVDQARRTPDMMRRVAIEIYSGPNVMAHHAPMPPRAGLQGGLDVMYNLSSLENKKYRAGAWLKAARFNRACGYIDAAAQSLERAVSWRRAAQKQIAEQKGASA